MDICDDFLTSLPIEPGMLLSSDRMDFAMDEVASSCSSELLDDGYICPPSAMHSPQAYTIKSELTSSCSSDESVDLNHFSDDFTTTVNPDDFLTDFFKSEVKSESNPFSPKRDTPSPSGSDSTGSDTMDYQIEMPNSSETYRHQHKTTTNNHLAFNTPPISPPSPDGSSSSSASSTSSRTSSNIHLQRTLHTGLQTVHGRPVNIVQGTLIPITTVPLNMSTMTSIPPTNLPQTFKKIKIQPKPAGNSNLLTNPIKKTGQAKTIILSAQDYSALVQKCKSQQSTPGDAKPITIKASNLKNFAPQSPMPVLPNVITPTIHSVQIDRPASAIQPQPIIVSGMITKAVPIVSPLNHPVQISATPMILQQRTVVPSSCVAAVRNVPSASQHHQVRVAPRPAGSSAPPVEEKIAKKHQRMIKNRESACLSRKKKKDYMTSLETQLAQLTDSNQKLRTQNTYLRDRVAQLEKAVCQCGKAITSRLSKPVLLPASTVTNKKNAMFLLAMVFMVSLNFGPFGNLLNPKMGSEITNPSEAPHHSRTLLWFDEDTNDNAINNNGSSKATTNSSMTFGYIDNIQNSTFDTERISSTTNNGYPMCPVHVNQSESVRLAGELRRWIGDLPYYLNINATEASSPSSQFDLNTISDYLLKDDTIKSLFRHLKSIEDNETPSKTAPNVHAAAQRQVAGRDQTGVSARQTSNQRIQVYDPVQRDALKYAELFEELRRQDDTFYVVSFSGDHLLLPALAHNKTVRPKMSLMLPSVGINTTVDASQFVTLMQIDCEVINTSLIQIQSRLIPPHLRNKGRYSGSRSTKSSNIKASSANRTATDYSKRTPSMRRPLQINQTSNQETVERGFNTTQNDGYGLEGNFNETSNLLFNATDKSDFGYQTQPQNQPNQFKPYFVDDPETVGKRKVRSGGVGGV